MVNAQILVELEHETIPEVNWWLKQTEELALENLHRLKNVILTLARVIIFFILSFILFIHFINEYIQNKLTEE